MIHHLSQAGDATLPSDGNSGSFNKRFGTDWYITAAIDRTGADKSLHVQLVDKANGEQAPYRDMKITTGLGGSAQNTVMYSSVEPMKQNQKVNDFAGVVPVLSPKQTTEYREKKTGDLLASYTQTGEISGDLYTIAGVAKFERYELIESPQPTEGALGSSYAVGSTFITHWLGYREASAKVVVDNNGSLRFIQFVINPDHPNFKRTMSGPIRLRQTSFRSR